MQGRKRLPQPCPPVDLMSRPPAAQRCNDPHPSPQHPLHHSPPQLWRETGPIGLGAQGRGSFWTKQHRWWGREHLNWRTGVHPYDKNYLQNRSRSWMNAIILHWAWCHYSIDLTIHAKIGILSLLSVKQHVQLTNNWSCNTPPCTPATVPPPRQGTIRPNTHPPTNETIWPV